LLYQETSRARRTAPRFVIAVFAAIAGLLLTALPAEAVGGDIYNTYPAGGAPDGYTNSGICPTGADACLDTIVNQMQTNYNTIGCSHNNAFADLYLFVTKNMRTAIRGGRFTDVPLWNRLTQTFGTYYLDAYNSWKANSTSSKVPESWRIAFNSAKNKQTSTLGDIYLAINAHVNRDLAYAYYQSGVPNSADHLKVNDILSETQVPGFAHISLHLDNTLPAQVLVQPTNVDLDFLAWREQAYSFAQQLAAAPDAAARGVIAQQIEANAVAHANAIKAAFPTSWLANLNRDAYCAVWK